MKIQALSKPNKCIFYALAGLLLRGTVVDLFKVFSMGWMEPVVNIIAFALFIVGLLQLVKLELKTIAISTITLTLLWVYSYYHFPGNKPYIEENFIQFFIYCLPFLWMGYYFVKSGLQLDLFLPIAKIKLVLALIVQIIIFIVPSADIFEGDYQTAAYSIIVGLIGVYYLSIRDKEISDILLSVFGTLILLLAGSRAIFLSVIFFWLIYLINKVNFKNSILIVIVALFISLFGFQTILKPIDVLSQRFGFSTHLSEALVSGTIMEDENRTLLYASFWEAAQDRRFGYGVMGDRYISYHDGFFFKPIYPHNIYLELIVDFGVIIGSTVFLILLFYLIKSFFFNKDETFKMTILVLTSTTFIKLLFATSFWIDQMFFMLVGALLGGYLIRKDRKRKLIRTKKISYENRNIDISSK